jgi:two-component system, chemotaxis family, response regulator Rcp1
MERRLSSTVEISTLVESGALLVPDAGLELADAPAPLSHPMGMKLDNGNGERSLEVLLVEDNPADVRLTREVLEADDSIHLTVVGDGEAALSFVRGEGVYEGSPRPNLVLLDLNLPRKDGREVLQELKADRRLSRIPVVVLTTSAAESDILRSYELHANCFMTKPLDLEDFFDAVRSIKDFWLSTARLPSA